MKFLLYLMDGGLNSFQGEMDCERLKYPQVDFFVIYDGDSQKSAET